MFWYIPKHHMTFSILGITMCSKGSMNFNVNWVFPHPEGPLTMELNGCLQDGSILQNEEDTGLNVIIILSFIQSAKCSYLYTECSYLQIIYKMSIKFLYNLQFIRVFSFQCNFIVAV